MRASSAATPQASVMWKKPRSAATGSTPDGAVRTCSLAASMGISCFAGYMRLTANLQDRPTRRSVGYRSGADPAGGVRLRGIGAQRLVRREVTVALDRQAEPPTHGRQFGEHQDLWGDRRFMRARLPPVPPPSWPTPEILMLSAPEHRGGVDRLSVEEELRFLDQAYAQDGRTGLMLQTLLETGARASELVQLRVEDVSLVERVVTIRQGKGGKCREVPIRRDVAATRLGLNFTQTVTFSWQCASSGHQSPNDTFMNGPGLASLIRLQIAAT